MNSWVNLILILGLTLPLATAAGPWFRILWRPRVSYHARALFVGRPRLPGVTPRAGFDRESPKPFLRLSGGTGGDPRRAESRRAVPIAGGGARVLAERPSPQGNEHAGSSCGRAVGRLFAVRHRSARCAGCAATRRMSLRSPTRYAFPKKSRGRGIQAAAAGPQRLPRRPGSHRASAATAAAGTQLTSAARMQALPLDDRHSGSRIQQLFSAGCTNTKAKKAPPPTKEKPGAERRRVGYARMSAWRSGSSEPVSIRPPATPARRKARSSSRPNV